MKRPRFQSRPHSLPRKADAKGIMRWLIAHCDGLETNSGKCLDFSLARRRQWIDRDRITGKHYLVEVRGNRLTAFEGQCDFPDGITPIFDRQKLLLEMPLAAYRTFLPVYKRLTPDLEWWVNE